MSTVIDTKNRPSDTDILNPLVGHLVVFLDDEPEILSALHRIFRREPYRVLMTSKPAEAFG